MVQESFTYSFIHKGIHLDDPQGTNKSVVATVLDTWSLDVLSVIWFL
jgi:hypothetical protein